jgi:hypothetical protein
MSFRPCLPLLLLAAFGCAANPDPASNQPAEEGVALVSVQPDSLRMDPVEEALEQYVTVRLTADLSALSDRERRMLPLLIDAARAMDEIFWVQAYGSRDSLLSALAGHPAMRRYAEINYGPWDRLAGDAPFVPGVGPRPKGANFYPADITAEELERAASGPRSDSLKSLYTLVRRDASGGLTAVPYHVAFRSHNETAAGKLREAAALAGTRGCAATSSSGPTRCSPTSTVPATWRGCT